MPYNVITFQALLKRYKDYILHVVSWGEDKKLTKYQAPAYERIHYYTESAYDYKSLMRLYMSLKPALVLVSGRMEKSYLKVARQARRDGVIVVGTADNQYFGTIKQRLAILLAKLLYRRYFEYMLVPGLYQYEYQRRLGYERDKILFPQYCADVDLFTPSKKTVGEEANRRGILFLGRLHPIKGIELLIKVHRKLYEEKTISDKLIIIGGGPLRDKLVLNHVDHLVYHPFMEQSAIIKIMAGVKYFCLPSRAEPWGVVIHEAACAGLPIITTKGCGAASTFVKHGYNGYLFSADDEEALAFYLTKMSQKNPAQIAEMARRSLSLSRQIQPDMWADTLASLIEDDYRTPLVSS